MMPRDTDIILGVGGISTNHAGNIWFRRHVQSHKSRYQQLEGKKKKGAFLMAILQHIMIKLGRRFYKKDSSNKYCIVGLDDRFADGHLILPHKVRNLLNAPPTTTTTAAIVNSAAIVNVSGGDSSNSTTSGNFLYFQTMKWQNRKGHLRCGAAL